MSYELIDAVRPRLLDKTLQSVRLLGGRFALFALFDRFARARLVRMYNIPGEFLATCWQSSMPRLGLAQRRHGTRECISIRRWLNATIVSCKTT